MKNIVVLIVSNNFMPYSLEDIEEIMNKKLSLMKEANYDQ